MTQQIHFVITNAGDGSNGVHWVTDEAVLERMEELANDGDDGYASGDGLQVNTLDFPDYFDLDNWMAYNAIRLTTLKDLEDL